MRRAVLVLAVGAVVAGGSAATASVIPGGLPDPRDCHQMNKLLHIDNVRDCSGSSVALKPPPVVGVSQRPDGAVCVTVSEQVPQCVGPID